MSTPEGPGDPVLAGETRALISPVVGVISTRSVHRGTLSRPRNLALLLGVGIIAMMIIGSFVIPALSSQGPRQLNPLQAAQAPSWSHPFGTDTSGFDVWVRAWYAPRVDFLVAGSGVGLGLIAGVVLGLIAGVSRGVLGDVILRVADLVQAFPLLILAVALVALSGNKLSNVVWAIAFVNTPIFLRLLRSQVLTVREHRYIEAAVALGNSRRRLVLRHILPNAIGPVIVQVGISLGYAIILLAGIAFLGVGVQVPTPEWGVMILQGEADIVTGQWWTAVFPGLMLALAVIGFNLISEGVEAAREGRR